MIPLNYNNFNLLVKVVKKIKQNLCKTKKIIIGKKKNF